jgi:hypothetical protein
MPTSTPLQPTITTAGLTAIFNAESTGVEFALTHIAFGTAQYTPDGSETALRAEMVRVPIAGGGRISPTQIQIYAVAMAALGHPFFVGEVGFFGNGGTTLLAVYSSTATPSLFLSDTVATSVSYALGLAALPANTVTVTIDPSASAALLIIGNHVAAADPHPQYVEKVNGVAFYDPTITFNQGAQIIGDDLLVYQSIQANNIGHAPSSSPTWWVPLYNYGDTPVAGLTNANVTLTSTQAARAHITFSGALAANLNIVFPTWTKDWTVVNNTTGAFALTCKTAAGTGIVIPQNGSPTKIRGDGTNITQPAENVATATQSQHAMQLGQATGRLLKRTVFTSSGTFTALAATNSIRAIIVGGGGAGGGAQATNSGQLAMGSGGASGSISEIGATTGFSGDIPVTIGAGGVAVSGNNGGTGGQSSLGSLANAPGGIGGPQGLVAATGYNISQPTSPGLPGTAGTVTYSILSGGTAGAAAFALNGAVVSGNGGAGYLGQGGAVGSVSGPGNNATGYGAGGSGAASGSSVAARIGGNGSAGIIIIEEFS